MKLKTLLLALLLSISLSVSADCYDGDDFNDCLNKAQQGSAYSQYLVGYSYHIGRGVSKDFNKAAYWYKKAAKNQNAVAQNHLVLLSI
jgi:hypothetical protein